MATNNYVPEFSTDNLPWYERDGLMTYIDKIKCDEFLEDPGKHFKEKEIVNFDVIHKSVRGEKVPESDFKKYQTVQDNRVKQYSQEHRDNFLSAAFRIDTIDLYFEKDVIQSHFSSSSQK